MRVDKKGSVTVFAAIFFSGLLILLIAFMEASKDRAAVSAAKSLGNLWVNSILAEYDVNLYERYGIFGFYGLQNDVEAKLDHYMKYSFQDKKYISSEGFSVDLSDFALTDTDVFGKQIRKAGIQAMTEGFTAGGSVGGDSVEDTEPSGDSVLRNGKVADYLPSSGNDKAVTASAIASLLRGRMSASELFEKGTDSYIQNRYINAYFKNGMDGKGLGTTFFENEMEYLICAGLSDKENLNGVRNRIIGIREILNIIYLNSDPEKSAAVTAAATAIAPGPGAIIVKQGIIAAWAFAESVNDYRLLMAGKKVPLTKDDSSWAIELTAILENRSEGMIDKGNTRGDTYEDYLNVMIFAMDEEVRLLRMMDLIQINMRLLYYDDFLLKTYNGGLRCSLLVNGRRLDYFGEY